MILRLSPRRAFASLALPAWLALLLIQTALADDTGVLRVLLTNDDGYDAPGIRAVATALRAAGHDVVTVAPRTQQSGTGMKISLRELRVTNAEPDVWIIDGTPADAVNFALRKVFEEAPPDIVISGANFGQNIGTNTNSSGTVGAALMAVQNGVPAIALSVGLEWVERNQDPPFASTHQAFAPAAELLTKLLGALRTEHHGRALLPPGLALNVNYPVRTPVRGVRVVTVGARGGFSMNYQQAQNSTEVQVVLAQEHSNDEQHDADLAAFDAGYVGISILDGNWGAPHAALEKLLRDIANKRFRGGIISR